MITDVVQHSVTNSPKLVPIGWIKCLAQITVAPFWFLSHDSACDGNSNRAAFRGLSDSCGQSSFALNNEYTGRHLIDLLSQFVGMRLKLKEFGDGAPLTLPAMVLPRFAEELQISKG